MTPTVHGLNCDTITQIYTGQVLLPRWSFTVKVVPPWFPDDGYQTGADVTFLNRQTRTVEPVIANAHGRNFSRQFVFKLLAFALVMSDLGFGAFDVAPFFAGAPNTAGGTSHTTDICRRQRFAAKERAQQ